MRGSSISILFLYEPPISEILCRLQIIIFTNVYIINLVIPLLNHEIINSTCLLAYTLKLLLRLITHV